MGDQSTEEARSEHQPPFFPALVSAVLYLIFTLLSVALYLSLNALRDSVGFGTFLWDGLGSVLLIFVLIAVIWQLLRHIAHRARRDVLYALLGMSILLAAGSIALIMLSHEKLEQALSLETLEEITLWALFSTMLMGSTLISITLLKTRGSFIAGMILMLISLSCALISFTQEESKDVTFTHTSMGWLPAYHVCAAHLFGVNELRSESAAQASFELNMSSGTLLRRTCILDEGEGARVVNSFLMWESMEKEDEHTLLHCHISHWPYLNYASYSFFWALLYFLLAHYSYEITRHLTGASRGT